MNRDLTKDVALVKTYAGDILGWKSSVPISAILFTGDPKTFAAAYSIAAERTVEVERGKFSFRKLKTTISEHFENMVVVPLVPDGVRELSFLLHDARDIRSEITEDLLKSGAYRRTSSRELIYGTRSFPLRSSDDGAFIAIVPQPDMISLARIQSIQRMCPDFRFRVLCKRELLEYCMAVLDGIAVSSLDGILEELYLTDKYQSVLHLSVKPRMMIEIEAEHKLLRDRELQRFFQKPKRNYTRRKSDSCEKITDESANVFDIPVIDGQLLSWDDIN